MGCDLSSAARQRAPLLTPFYPLIRRLYPGQLTTTDAIAYGHTPRDTPFTEQDWTNVDAGIAPYQKSKTLPERAAWDFVAGEGRAD